MINAIIGGTLIGAAAVWLWLSLGRVAGISGIAAQALTKSRAALWPLLFVIGLGQQQDRKWSPFDVFAASQHRATSFS